MFNLLVLLGLSALATQLQATALFPYSYHDTDGYYPAAQAAIPGFSPMFDIYSYWDTLNLDPYKFDLRELSGDIRLQVLDADCGFALPAAGAVTSGFGWRWGRMHAGVDIPIKTGDTIVSAFDGVVRMSTWYYGYGNCVVVRHHNGLETLYGHLSSRLVKPGDLVNAGQPVGLGGSTGYSTGPHLHFETRIMGKAFNPEQLIDFKKDSLLKDTLTFTATTLAAPVAPVYRSYYRSGYRSSYYRKSSAYRRRR